MSSYRLGKKFAEHCYRTRVRAELTQNQLAEKAGVSFDAIQRLEAGDNVKIYTLQKIARGMGKELLISFVAEGLGNA